MKNNPEYHICNKCGVYMRILSTRKDGTNYYSPILRCCPQCTSKDIKEISREKYDNVDVIRGLWILVKKRYGKKTIKFSLKYEGLKDGNSIY